MQSCNEAMMTTSQIKSARLLHHQSQLWYAMLNRHLVSIALQDNQHAGFAPRLAGHKTLQAMVSSLSPTTRPSRNIHHHFSCDFLPRNSVLCPLSIPRVGVVGKTSTSAFARAFSFAQEWISPSSMVLSLWTPRIGSGSLADLQTVNLTDVCNEQVHDLSYEGVEC